VLSSRVLLSIASKVVVKWALELCDSLLGLPEVALCGVARPCCLAYQGWLWVPLVLVDGIWHDPDCLSLYSCVVYSCKQKKRRFIPWLA